MDQHVRLHRRALSLACISAGWMMIEAALAVTAGILAASFALAWLRPGLCDRVLSALIVVWQLHGQGQERETRAVRLIGVTFFALPAHLAARASGT